LEQHVRTLTPQLLRSLAGGRLLRRVGAAAFVAAVAILVLAPLARLLLLSTEDGGAAFRTAARIDGVGHVVRTTALLAVGSLTIAIGCGTALAWASTRLSARFRWLSAIPVLPIVVPPVAGVTAWVFLFSPRTGYGNQLLRNVPGVDGDTGPIDIFTTPWIIVVSGIVLTSFVYVFARTGLRAIDDELLEAARVCGASERRAFFGIALPLLRPALLYGGGLALVLGLGQFTAPLLLGTRENVRVLTTEMYRWTASIPVDFGVAAAIGSPLLAVGVAGVMVQRLLLRSQDRYITHSGRASRPAERSSAVACLIIGLFGLLTIILPLGALVIVALSPYYSGSIDVGGFTLDNFRHVHSNPLTRQAIETSLRCSLAGVAVTLPVAYGAATLIHARPGSLLARTADFVVNLPLCVPAAVFGAAMAYVYSRPPVILYGTDWILVTAYVTLMLPFAVRTILTGRVTLGDQYGAASRTCGAGPVRTQLQIMLPLMRGTLAAAAGLTFVLMSHEFAASLLVRSRRTEVMGTRLYDLFESSSYPVSAAMALVMIAITAIGLSIMTILGERRALLR
jgi:iron(III) transport system permease protein